MGASPGQQEIQKIQGSLASALKNQQQVKRDIKQDVRQYRQRSLGELETLESASGTKLPDYISAVKQQFGNIPTIEATQQKYEQALQNFDPGLIGSASDQRLRQSLMQSAQQYAQGIGDVAGEVSGRLYQTLDAPKAVFEDLASSAATNLQIDPRAMMVATRPKTIRSDVGSMKDLYTYNV
jgi:hypothetical protein